MNKDISVILNVYKRPYTLEAQIEAIKNQTVGIPSENIHVWYNDADVEQFLPEDENIKTYECNWNTKFFGRFMIPLLCQTPYIAMLDDDVIPGKRWFENCLTTIDEVNGILGSSGVVLHQKSYMPNHKVGWNGQHLNETSQVDLVGHGWFFKQEWAKYMWMEEPPSWDNGEDMFFSYMAQKNGIDTFVPPHPPNNKEMWGNVPGRDKNWGFDKNAHSLTHNNHLNLRGKIVSNLVDKGWQTVRKVK